MGRRLLGWVVVVACVLAAWTASPAVAAPVEARVQLHDGKLATADLSRVLLDNFHLHGLSLNVGTIDMSGLEGTAFVRALNTALAGGGSVHVEPDALVLSVDGSKLPHDIRAAKHDLEIFTATVAPQATARQRRFYGLLMPQKVDANRPMVVLVHGLDCDRTNWFPMADLLIGQGYQVAYFTYPSDGPLADSGDMLAKEMTALHEEFPTMTLDIVAHSMGGLVARDYVEGDRYAGGVNHLILLGTPNLGSKWASYRMILEVQEHYHLWKHEKDWSPSWMITDGLGEAGSDLKPNSAFLARLNDHPRRAGVSYTIVAGSQHPAYAIGANTLSGAAHLIPERAAKWWGFRQTDAALERGADKLRGHVGKSDGPVTLKSTHLDGVNDFVALPCDHAALYYPIDGKIAAWDVIRDRLAK